MASYRTCDGMYRRDFLKIGAIGGAGFTLANYLRWSKASEVQPARAKAGIFIHLVGGPSHLDTFDLKPNAPREFRGPFNPSATNVPGVQICEHLPKLAACADKFVILRGVTHTLGVHALGSQYVNTGTRPIASLEYPGYGAVISKEIKPPKDLPPFVAIPRNPYQHGGFLGIKYGPLNTANVPAANQPFSVRGVVLEDGVTLKEVDRRRSLLRDLDTAFRGYEAQDQLLESLDEFDRQAYQIIISPRSREAFDVGKESPSFAARFGSTPLGMSCLLAVRLIQFGVRFITISSGNWDTHEDNFVRLKEDLLPPFDEGISGLISGLSERGLLDSTAVFITGEFGRTPKINDKSQDGGRDHYPRCMTMLMAGGGIRGGQVLGESDDKATSPKNDGYSPDDVAASFYHALGVDHQKEYHTTTGRPVQIVREGAVISELFA